MGLSLLLDVRVPKETVAGLTLIWANAPMAWSLKDDESVSVVVLSVTSTNTSHPSAPTPPAANAATGLGTKFRTKSPLVAELVGLIVLNTLHDPVVGDVSAKLLELNGEPLVQVNTALVSTASAPVAAAVIAPSLGSASEGSKSRITLMLWVSSVVSLS